MQYNPTFISATAMDFLCEKMNWKGNFLFIATGRKIGKELALICFFLGKKGGIDR